MSSLWPNLFYPLRVWTEKFFDMEKDKRRRWKKKWKGHYSRAALKKKKIICDIKNDQLLKTQWLPSLIFSNQKKKSLHPLELKRTCWWFVCVCVCVISCENLFWYPISDAFGYTNTEPVSLTTSSTKRGRRSGQRRHSIRTVRVFFFIFNFVTESRWSHTIYSVW